MMTFHRLGTLPLPTWAAEEALRSIDRRGISLNDVGQVRDVPRFVEHFGSLIGVSPDKEDSILQFRDVERHTDESFPETMFWNKRWLRVGFLHVALVGEFTLKFRRQQHIIKPGDVFLVNPHKQHSVDAQGKLCATLVFVVPLCKWVGKQI